MCNNSINRIKRERKLVFDERKEKENCSRVKDAGCAQVADRDELKTHQFENQPFNPNYRTTFDSTWLDK